MLRALIVCLGVFSVIAITDANAETYASLRGGGAQIWQACENSNELEGRCGWPLTGWAVAGAVGVEHDLSPDWALRSEFEVSHRSHDIHGYNGKKCDRDDCSADHLDDNTLGVTVAGVNAIPAYHVTDRLDVYGGVGVGVGYFTGLSDEAFAPVVQGRVGASYDLTEYFMPGEKDRLSVDLAGVVVQGITKPELDGNSVEYTAYGPMLGITWKF